MAIIVQCPNCRTRLTVGDDRAGETFECPRCDAAMTIPFPAAPPPGKSRAASLPSPDAEEPDEDESRSRRPRRREDDDEPRLRRRRFPCPNCSSTAVPLVRQRISTTGWIVFAVLLIFTVCFFWVGLLIREEYRVCPECGMELP